jgi:mono/diheme cytochrome c family protein
MIGVNELLPRYADTLPIQGEETTMASPAIPRRAPISLVAATALMALCGTPATAQGDQSARGLKLVMEKCARCHATGRADLSPDPKAPPFRNFGKTYPPEHLAEALAEGIVTGDNNMPEFKFDPRDVDAIIDYLAMISSHR